MALASRNRFAEQFANRHARRGVTLLEVLISMFVLLIGLLGVGALIPVARFEVVEGLKTDRVMALGQSAFREMKIRGMLRGSYVSIANASSASASASIASTETVVIDPLAVCHPSSTNRYGILFPKNTSTTYAVTAPTTATPNPAKYCFVRRMSLWSGQSSPLSSQDFNAMRAMADQVFRSQDDLTFDFRNQNDSDAYPAQLYVPYTTTISAKNFDGARRQNNGDYSWFATLSPDPFVGSGRRNLYAVSVAICYKRDLSSAGAGEFRYPNTYLPGGPEIILPFVTGGYPSIKPGRWIMLTGSPDGNTTGPNASNQIVPIRQLHWYHKWYKVLSTTTNQSGNFQITLAGADWPVRETKASEAAVNSPSCTEVWVVDGVIGVYEKNLRIESASPWIFP